MNAFQVHVVHVEFPVVLYILIMEKLNLRVIFMLWLSTYSSSWMLYSFWYHLLPLRFFVALIWSVVPYLWEISCKVYNIIFLNLYNTQLLNNLSNSVIFLLCLSKLDFFCHISKNYFVLIIETIYNIFT